MTEEEKKLLRDVSIELYAMSLAVGALMRTHPEKEKLRVELNRVITEHQVKNSLVGVDLPQDQVRVAFAAYLRSLD